MGLPLAFAAALLLAGTWPAAANVMWPALVMEQRLSSPFVIALGLAVEWALIRWIFGFAPLRALWAALAANAASAALGFLGRPFLGAVWSVLPNLVGLPTFGPLDWAGTFVVAVLANLLVEALVLRFGFELPMTWRNLLWLALANAATIGAAYASTAAFPLDWH
jgi:hypothetical protein